jgi:serine protease Do
MRLFFNDLRSTKEATEIGRFGSGRARRRSAGPALAFVALATVIAIALVARSTLRSGGVVDRPKPQDATAPRGGDSVQGDDSWLLLDRFEQRVGESITAARMSTLALEYTPAGASGNSVRRVATGIVLNDSGDVLSIRIDPPPPGAPVVARDADGKARSTRWLAADHDTGLTLLRVDESSGLRPVRSATRAAVLGMSVFVVGNPYGLGQSVSRGHVAGLNRHVKIGHSKLGALIQLDVPLRPGDNGALVANLRGEWLGQIRGVLSPADPPNPDDKKPGVGFAIKADDAAWVADQLRAHRKVDRAYLGVRLVFEPKPKAPGAIISEVIADGPAAKAGVKPGDRVIAALGGPISDPQSLIDLLDRTVARTIVSLELDRDGTAQSVRVETASRPVETNNDHNPIKKP